jgi:hypothetical protein
MLLGVDRALSYVCLAIERASEPIQGSVSTAGQSTRTFSGWIELTEAIEEARAAGEAAPTGQSHENGPGGKL